MLIRKPSPAIHYKSSLRYGLSISIRFKEQGLYSYDVAKAKMEIFNYTSVKTDGTHHEAIGSATFYNIYYFFAIFLFPI